ncbi:MAG TPA: hypothetical protein VFF63_04925, partial [Candidatus Babeliales bacterium]|nr:hypothetical protein [Candidatus Babeliales bacterium]
MFNLSYARAASGAILATAALGLSLGACSSGSLAPTQPAGPQSQMATKRSAQYAPATSPSPGFTPLYQFAGAPDGASPWGGVIVNSKGVIFGSTFDGGFVPGSGGAGYGTVFELKPTASGYTESVLYRFKGFANGDGQNPFDAPLAVGA